jgi:hypothetical protein
MTQTHRSPVFAGDRILDVMGEPDTETDDLKRLAELTRSALLEGRASRGCTIAVVAQSRQIRSMSRTAIQKAKEKLASFEPGILLTEVHSMDEERRSLAELQILQNGTPK